ncbi:MAG: NUDIX hydrolase [Gammaproteobacteria bacterium]|nr:NUDIX hydrolase [Gammaproteobacteria bacterium]
MATIGAFAVIFDAAGQVLCVKANYGSCYWGTPGGRVETGESPAATLKREVFEETGYLIEPGHLIGVYAKPYRDDLVLSFRATILAREPWRPNQEIAEIGFFSPVALPEGMGVIARTRIMDAVTNQKGVYRVFEVPDLED